MILIRAFLFQNDSMADIITDKRHVAYRLKYSCCNKH